MKCRLFVLPLAVLAFSCTRNDGSRSLAVEESAPFPRDRVDCGAEGEGQLVLMKFSPLSTEALAIDGLKGDYSFVGFRKTRIEVCINLITLEVTPRRVVTDMSGGAGAWSAPKARVLTNTKPDAGFAQGFTEGDWTSLQMEFPTTEADKASYLLKGWKLADGRQVVTLSPFRGGGSPLEVSGSRAEVLVGVLEEGDPWVRFDDCHSKSFDVPGLRLSYRFCKQGDHGTRISYQFKSLSVSDTRVDLEKPIEVSYGENETPIHMKNTETHHSLSDEFRIEVEGSRYEIRYAGSETMVLSVIRPDGAESSFPLNCQRVYQCGAEAGASPRPFF